jgi:hypothetical protein
MRTATPEPTGEKSDVFAPILESHVVKSAGAFPNSTVIVAKNLDVSGRQIACPANPRKVRVLSFRGEGTDEQDARSRVLDLVQDGVKVRAGYLKVSGALRRMFARMKLPLHFATPVSAD